MDHNDPLGLYRALGLTPSATARQIKAAFRKRSKETHPDTSGRESAKEFVQVSAAYEVLGDAARRGKYDRSSWEPFKRDAEVKKERAQESEFYADRGEIRIDPICCDFCGKVTAQPRYLTFSYLIGLVVWAHVDGASGIFCVRCARRKGILYSLVTMVTGWWIFPVGPYCAVLVIIRNGFATSQVNEDDYKLILHNVEAFYFRRELKLAYSLARFARQSPDYSISRDAEKYMKIIESSDAECSSQRLENVWGKPLFWELVHAVIAFILPVCLGVVIYNFFEAELARIRDEELYPRIAQADVSLCKNPPINGQAIGPQPSASPGHSVSIRNGSRYKMIVKLRNVYSGRVAAALFVDSGQEAWVHHVPIGDYMIQYAAGEGFDASCSKFVDVYGINALREKVFLRGLGMNKSVVFMGSGRFYIDDIHDRIEYRRVGRFGRENVYYETFSVEQFNMR